MQRGEHTIARLYKAHDGGPALNCSYTTCGTETGELEQLAVVIELLSNSEGAKAIVKLAQGSFAARGLLTVRNNLICLADRRQRQNTLDLGVITSPGFLQGSILSDRLGG